VGEGFLSYDDLSVIEPDDLMEIGGLSAEAVEAIVNEAERRAQLAEEAAADIAEPSADDQEVFSLPITDLNLSVRARKCTTKLGITTIGELVRRTAEDLMECKNFGVTSLNEVREKLVERGLKLRGD